MAGSGAVIAKMWAWAAEKRIALEAISKVTASNATNYAKTNKRWRDQTGNARAGLHGGSFWESPTILKAYIAHSMEYGIYLELAHDRKFQILEESLKQFQDSWYNSIKRIMEH
ncbi:MAG: hypothetical protein ACYDIA_01725 [Candidatus Humimicrobiaceae bacterium]